MNTFAWMTLVAWQATAYAVPLPEDFRAMDAFVQEGVLLKLSTIPPSEFPSDGVLILEAAIGSVVSPEVVRRGIGMFGQLALYDYGAVDLMKRRVIDDTVATRLRPRIWSLLNDSDSRTREMAMNTLVLLATTNRDQDELAKVEAWMLNAFSSEEPNVRRQIAARSRLLSSTESESVLLLALEDENDAVQQQAALVLAERRPPAGLAGLVARLGRGGGGSGTRAAVAQAIAAYGADAAGFEDTLRAALESEADPFVRSALELALQQMGAR